MLSSRDGYCTIVVFDEILAAYHTQQQTLQLQSIAHHHSVPITYSAPASSGTSSSSSANHPIVVTSAVAKKRQEPPLTPAASVDDNLPALHAQGSSSSIATDAANVGDETKALHGPPKKKRRVALTKVGDIES
jgi:chromatin assembly factor 1 subunit B